MRKFNYICSFLLILLLSLFIVTLGQNLIVRTSGAYLYHFNDSRSLDSLHVDYSSSDMADDFARFMNSWRPEEFQVYEDTGYDLQGIFDKRDSDNMLRIKTAADVSLIICLLSFIGSLAIYIYFLRNDFKLVLRKRLKAVWIVSALLLAGEGLVFFTKGGLAQAASLVGFRALAEDSALAAALGGGFLHLAAVLAIASSVLAAAALSYLTYVLTKPPRIFY